MTLDSPTDAWELEDAVDRHRNAPDLYSCPGNAERGSLCAGDRAELLFLFRGRDQHGVFTQSERIPVTVCDVSDGAFRGRLEAAPKCSPLLRAGDSITFEARHVARIHRVEGV